MSRQSDNSHWDDEADLRARFAKQRLGDHANAPAWRDEWLRMPAMAGMRGPRRKVMRWLPLALGAACVVLAAAVMWAPSSSNEELRLSEALPPLFDEARGELFAGLGPSASLSSSFTVLESPSDFLLPDALQSNLNLLNLP